MLEIGEKVVIKKVLMMRHTTLNITSEMEKYQGKDARIVDYTMINEVFYGYQLDIDGGKFTWGDYWFE